MEIFNLSAEPDWRLHTWIPHGLTAEKIVFLPDACPGKSPLPTGTVVLTRQPDWRRFAVSDCGCGMRLVECELAASDLTTEMWDVIASKLRSGKGGLGDLGGGNHFLDALTPKPDGGNLFLLIHTGSRLESGLVDAYIEQPVKFDSEFDRVVSWAEENRATIHRVAEEVLGPTKLILDLPHNTYEYDDEGGVIIRKGSVRVLPGDLNIIPSTMTGDVSLVRVTEKIHDTLCSLSHGTGRAMPRSECKAIVDAYDFGALRERIMLPQGLEDASLRTEGPFAYRDLDTCLDLLNGFVEEVRRFRVIAYMGHL